MRVKRIKLEAAETIRSPVPKPRRSADSLGYGRCSGSMPTRNPAAIRRYKPACGVSDWKPERCPPAAPTTSAQSNTRIPVARDANAITTRSLNFGSSTYQICTISSTRSMAAQINTNVSGLSATTAKTPREVRRRVPAQLIGLGNFARTTVVMTIAKHNVTRLKTKTQEILSATNVGDWEKIVVGCQLANCRLIGSCNCQMGTLSHAKNAPPTANNQLYRKPGSMIRNTTSVTAVSNKIRNVIRMNMQRQFYQVCLARFRVDK